MMSHPPMSVSAGPVASRSRMDASLPRCSRALFCPPLGQTSVRSRVRHSQPLLSPSLLPVQPAPTSHCPCMDLKAWIGIARVKGATGARGNSTPAVRSFDFESASPPLPVGDTPPEPRARESHHCSYFTAHSK
jgi:hypothetical protein